MIFKKKSIAIFSLLLLLIGGGVLWYAGTAQGVNRTWDGGGVDGTCGGAGTANNWSCAANWSADTVPTSADIAIFDGTSTKNATINSSLSGGSAPAGISINSGYTGTITQATGVTILVGSSGFTQAAGTFTGGNSSIQFNGHFTLSGGTYTSTSGTFYLGQCSFASSNFTHTAGGTFNHNNGTVTFTDNNTVDVATSETFYNMSRSCTNRTTTIASGDTLIVLNTFTHTDGVFNTGTIEARGNMVVGSELSYGGDATISFLVAGDQTITGSGGQTASLNINKSSGTVSVTGNLRIKNFTLTGGIFTSTSGTLTVGACAVGGGNFTHTAGGTFNHNNGTVEFTETGTVDVASTETFYNLTKSCNVRTTTVAAGDTLIVLGTLTHIDGSLNTGTIEARGNTVIGSAGSYGTATISFLVAGDQTITASGGSTSNLNISKPSGTVSALGDFMVSNFTLSGGVFTSTTGTLTVGASGSYGGSWTHTVGGTFNHNNGTVNLNSDNATTIDVSTSETFYNLTITGASRTFTIASGDTLIVLGTFTHTNNTLNTGTIEARGNVVIGASAGGGTTTISFTGSNNQTYTDQGGNELDGDITINKSGGTVTLASNADWNAASQDLTVTAGTLFAPDASITTTTLTVGASGVLKMFGSQTLTLAGTLSNSGVIQMWGSGVCGGGDNALIRSSSNGVQRSWNGAGTFTLYDIDVRDMAGSATITLYSSTNTANNGANWTFSGAACPAIPPAVTIPSGIINFQSGIFNLR